MQLKAVPRQFIPEIWPFAIHELRRAELYALEGLPEHELYGSLLQGLRTLWVYGERRPLAYVVTELLANDNGLVAVVRYLAGEYGVLQDIEQIKVLEDWAYYQGADELLIYGRAGWKKVLAPFGFEQKAVVLGKPLRASRFN